ncbi:MAG: sensor histidine kinase [Anaerolineales bacterium]|jgi:signal transduction histidine kinase
MDRFHIALIFFVYGLAFFSMGLATSLEAGRASDRRLRRALGFLAVFGLLHGLHEWIEMFELLGLLPGVQRAPIAWMSVRVVMLALSFPPLGIFGLALAWERPQRRHLDLLIPLGLVLLWGLGCLVLRSFFALPEILFVADVWARYTLAIPSALMAAVGLVLQCRRFQREELTYFGRSCLWAAVAFALYGAIGQLFVRKTGLPPSTIINQDQFQAWFGFPIQLLRAMTAVLAAFFILRLLRAFELEVQHKIADLQEARLRDAERREAQRRELFKHIVAAQESERQRIALELHDETGQALTAVGLGLRGLENAVGDCSSHAATNLRHLEELVTHSLNELQRIISDLRPSHLDDLGLPAALRWYASEVTERSGIEVNVSFEGEPVSLASAVKTTLFRVAQEALTNVVKHADASAVCLELTYLENDVQMRVVDNGCGFDQDLMQMQGRSWGLIGMQERASLLGGCFRLFSRPGEGTTVEVEIPYEPKKVMDHEDSLAAGG